MTENIRLATEADAEQMLEIYAPIVRDTPISFEVKPPSEEEFRERIKATLERTPWIVCSTGDLVLGYTYAGSHRTREAYRWSVDCSIYIHSDHIGHGIGKALYTSLFACLRVQGLYNVFAGITLPNSPSVALHEGMGFELVGIYRSVGYKLEHWHDVGWWHLALQEHRSSPSSPRLLGDVLTTREWLDAMAQGQQLLSRGLL